MRVLITGATGLIGSAITSICQERDIAVNYLTTSKDKLVQTDNYRGFHWDPSRGEIDLDCFEGIDGIINLAGAPIAKRWTNSYKKTILDSRVDSLRTLRRGLAKFGPSSIEGMVSASAIGIYPHSLTTLYSEDDPVEIDGFLAQVVSEWEAEADRFKEFTIPVAKVRIGLVLSADGGALQPLEKTIRNYVGAPLGSGRQWQSWIHIADLARMFLFLLDANIDGVFNGVAPNPVIQKKLVHLLAKELNKPLILPNVPGVVLKLALGDMSQVVLDSQRVSSTKIQNKGFDFRFVNLENALADLYPK